MNEYRLISYEFNGKGRSGLVQGDALYDVAAESGIELYETVEGILSEWDRAQPVLLDLAGRQKAGRSSKSVRWLAPVANPGAVLCAGANYTDHVIEMTEAQGMKPEPDPRDVGLKSWHFLKPARSIAGPSEDIGLPRRSQRVDYEAELAAVIGRKAKDVRSDEALSYVAGYMVANDLSARDFTQREQVPAGSPFKFDWVAHKCFDQSCPIGPWIVPAGEIADPQSLRIELWLNGQKRQDSSTQKMIFSLAEQISHLSEKMTLMPGDVILTGTPAGVGTARGEFLKPGDEIRIVIEKIGELTNRMV